MTTPNIVPRGNGEGGIGTNEKFWKNGYFENLYTRDGAVSTENYVQQKIEEHNSAAQVHAANIASKAEAEAGTDTFKFMTPARTREAMQVFVGGDLTGIILPFAGTTIPNGYLACNGAAVSRTTYATLFAVIGTTYGAGNGSTTFNLPNLENDSFMEFSGTVGTAKSAGLPNITGDWKTWAWAPWEGQGAVAMTKTGGTFPVSAGDNSDMKDTLFSFKASKSNSIYGNSTTVQPKSLTVKAIIKY